MDWKMTKIDVADEETRVQSIMVSSISGRETNQAT